MAIALARGNIIHLDNETEMKLEGNRVLVRLRKHYCKECSVVITPENESFDSPGKCWGCADGHEFQSDQGDAVNRTFEAMGI